MSYNPNHLLNNNLAYLNPALTAKPAPEAAPVPPPPFDPDMYTNAYGRLGLLGIRNVADLGCGAGNFVSIMTKRRMRPEMYVGIDFNHDQISIAKAAYPGWKFIYGDFTSERIRMEYDRFDAYLMIDLLDSMDDDISFLQSLPEGKHLVFTLPRFEREGARFFASEGKEINDRYSSIIKLKSVGRFKVARTGEVHSLVLACRW